MSHTVKIHNTILEMDLITDAEINADAPAIRSLYEALTQFGTLANVSEIRFIQDIGNPDLYSYDIQRKDALTFASTLLFDSDQDIDPDISFNVPVAWPASELTFAVQPLARILMDLRAAVMIESLVVIFA